MSKNREKIEVIKLFIGSPGDLVPERQAVSQIIETVNKNKARSLGKMFEAVGWEDSSPGQGRPQEIINAEIKKCDIVSIMFWRKWGSPTGAYSSGTEEEFEFARSLQREHNKPEIFLWFKTMEDAIFLDPGDQAKKVIDFRKKIEDERQFFYKTFENLDQWKEKFRDFLFKWLDGNSYELIDSSPPQESSATDVSTLDNSQKSPKIQAIEHLLMATNFVLQGKNISAEESFVKSLALDETRTALEEYGRFLFNVGSFEKSLIQFKKLERLGMDCQALALLFLGKSYRSNGNNKLSENTFLKGLGLFKKSQNQIGMASTLGDLGNLFRENEEYEKALNFYKKALSIAKKTGNQETMAHCYHNLGGFYLRIDDLDQAEVMYESAKKISHKSGNDIGVSTQLGNLASVHFKKGAFVRAKELYNEALKIEKRHTRKVPMGNLYNNLGNLSYKQKNWAEAISNYQKALDIFTEVKNPNLQIHMKAMILKSTNKLPESKSRN